MGMCSACTEETFVDSSHNASAPVFLSDGTRHFGILSELDFKRFGFKGTGAAIDLNFSSKVALHGPENPSFLLQSAVLGEYWFIHHAK